MLIGLLVWMEMSRRPWLISTGVVGALIASPSIGSEMRGTYGRWCGCQERGLDFLCSCKQDLPRPRRVDLVQCSQSLDTTVHRVHRLRPLARAEMDGDPPPWTDSSLLRDATNIPHVQVQYSNSVLPTGVGSSNLPGIKHMMICRLSGRAIPNDETFAPPKGLSLAEKTAFQAIL